MTGPCHMYQMYDTFFYVLNKECDYRAEEVCVRDGQTLFRFYYKDGEAEKNMELLCW